MVRDRLSAVALRVVVIAGVCVFAVYVGEWLALIVNDASKAADYTAFMTGLPSSSISMSTVGVGFL